MILATPVACAVLLAAGARKLVHHTEMGEKIGRAAPYVMPFMLIAIGIFILADTPTDVVLDAAP